MRAGHPLTIIFFFLDPEEIVRARGSCSLRCFFVPRFAEDCSRASSAVVLAVHGFVTSFSLIIGTGLIGASFSREGRKTTPGEAVPRVSVENTRLAWLRKWHILLYSTALSPPVS